MAFVAGPDGGQGEALGGVLWVLMIRTECHGGGGRLGTGGAAGLGCKVWEAGSLLARRGLDSFLQGCMFATRLGSPVLGGASMELMTSWPLRVGPGLQE